MAGDGDVDAWRAKRSQTGDESPKEVALKKRKMAVQVACVVVETRRCRSRKAFHVCETFGKRLPSACPYTLLALAVKKILDVCV